MPGAKPHVVILGGGYVAIYACRALAPAVKAGKLEVTVISRENYQVFHGFVGEMLTGRLSPSHILSPARRIFPGARFHLAEIQRIDVKRKNITTTRKLDDARFDIQYDHLVICPGSTDRSEAYPGLAEHAFKLKTYGELLSLRNHMISMFELADIEQNEEERRRLLTFFIAGGGYAGTEIAGELSDLMRRLTKKEYKGINRAEARVVLVHPGPTILPELYGDDGTGAKAHPKLVEFGMQRMRDLGVEVMVNTKVAAATPDEVHLSNGDVIPTRTIISAVGTKVPPIVSSLNVPKDPRGRIKTTRTIQVEGFDDVWAGGDSAAVPMADSWGRDSGESCPPVAIYAMKQGHKIGKNIARIVDGKQADAVPLPGHRPGRVGRQPLRRRRAQGDRADRLPGLARLALPADLLLPELGPAAAADDRLVHLAARRARHRRAALRVRGRLRDPPQHLPARLGDRRGGQDPALHPRDRRGRGRDPQQEGRPRAGADACSARAITSARAGSTRSTPRSRGPRRS